MPGFPTQHPALSFRLRTARDGSAPFQASVDGQMNDTTAARDNPDARLAPEFFVDEEELFQEVVRLAARSAQPLTPTENMSRREAWRLIEAEQINAARKHDYWSDKQALLHSKSRGKGKKTGATQRLSDRSDGDGLDDLNRLFAQASHEEEAQDDDRFEEDGRDDPNRLIPLTEQSVDGIGGEMDVEFGGMRDALATGDEWRNSSDAMRAGLEKAMQAARAHGDYISRFDPHAFEKLAKAQQQLFRETGDGTTMDM